MAKIIGSKDCPIISICNTLRHTSAFEQAPSDWVKVAREFIGDDAKEISDCIEYKDWSLYEAYRNLLDRLKGAELDSLIKTLDDHKLFDAADEIRKRFDCKPKAIDDLEIAFQDLDVRNEEKRHVYNNISELADETNVTEGLLSKLKEKNILLQSDIDELNKVCKDSKGLALFDIIAKANFAYFALHNLIQVLDADGQYGPSWILRDFYVWAAKNKDSLKKKSVPISENLRNSLPPSEQTQSSFFPFLIPLMYAYENFENPEYNISEQPRCDLVSQNTPIC